MLTLLILLTFASPADAAAPKKKAPVVQKKAPKLPEDCPPPVTGAQIAALQAKILQNFCVLQKVLATDEAKVKALAAKHTGGKVVSIVTGPSDEVTMERASSSVTFRFKEEKVLMPGETIYFGVPPDIAARPVNFVILGHRQDKAMDKGWEASRPGWDDVPGLTSVQFHSATPGEGWRYWQGDASGSSGSKYAEVRDTPEMENLYEWRKWGHGKVGGGDSKTTPLRVEAMRLTNTGKDHVKISELMLKVQSRPAKDFIGQIFSPGTEMGDHESGDGQKYGGGQSFDGKFPEALALRSWGSTPPPLPHGWRMVKGKLHIPLPPNVNITGIEIAAGDSHPDGVRNKDGGTGTPGWSRLYAYIEKKSGTRDYLMQNENVPPEGFLSGSPSDTCYRTQSGDELVVEAMKDVTYVMGLRVGIVPAPK